VPQRSVYDDLYPLLARDVVAMGVERRWSFLVPRFREPPAVRHALADAGAADLADRPFRQLSEGQKQRVLLARLAASKPDLALLDEPTAAMDVVAERDAFQHLDHLRREHGVAIVVVSHFIGLAREFADRALFLERDTQTVVVGKPDEVLASHEFRRSFGDLEEAVEVSRDG
jgi:zinc transport system ATP-binding protein